MRIEQLMTRVVHVCRPDQSLNDAAQLMWDHDLGCVPVVDPENKVIGMITDRDIAMAAYTQGRSLPAIQVEDVMSRRVRTCGPSEDIDVAQERMRNYQLRRLAVTDATGVLVGVISLNDLALEGAREHRLRRAPVRLESVAVTLARISEHRGFEQIVAAQ